MTGNKFEHKPAQNLTRRGFIKVSLAACAVTAVPTTFIGCKSIEYPKDNCISLIPDSKIHPSKNAFEATSLGPINVRNRLVRSATTFMAADEFGRPTQPLLDMYTELAKGGVGTIITGMGDTGLVLDNETFKDDHIDDYRKVPRAIHKFGSAAIQQISHRGSQLGMASDESLFSLNKLSDLEIQQLIEQFVNAIERSKRAGFDGVQLHGAHGYLLSEFLSPAMNRRTDKWGGTTEKRFKIIKEIIKRSKEKTNDFPIFIKVNGYDFQENGMTEKEAVKIAKLLENAGCDGIEVSSGVGKDGFSTIRVPEIPIDAILEFTKYKDRSSPVKYMIKALGPAVVKRYAPLYNYNACVAAAIKKNVTIPVIVVGGIRTITDIQKTIGHNMADFVAMGRPFIIEPDIVNSFEKTNQVESECINCGFCIIGAAAGKVKCYYGEVS